MTVEQLPPSYTFGKVTGRVLHSIADTAEDEDDKPQARAAAGSVHFTPAEVLRKVTADPSAFVLSKDETANLSSSGRILDGEGRQGVWLVTGVYTVSFTFTGESKDARIPPFDIEVTEAHTDASPLDLVAAAPPDPPSNVTLVTYSAPSGGIPGQLLAKGASPNGLVWTDPSGLADGSVITAKLAADAITSTKVSAAIRASLALADTASQPGHAHAWGDVTGKPSTYPPAAHNQAASTITDLTETVQDIVAALIIPGANLTADYNDVVGSLTLDATGGGGSGTPDDDSVSTVKIQDDAVAEGKLSEDVRISLDLADTALQNIDLTTVPAGYIHTIQQNSGGTWPSAGSTRTDIRYMWISRPDNTTQPTGVSGAVNLYDYLAD